MSSRSQDKKAALAFMKNALKRHSSPERITTDGLKSYRAAMKELGNSERQGYRQARQQQGRKQSPAIPTTRASDAALRQMKTLQKFASVHANVHNHFNLERHLVDRTTYKERRSAALAEWESLAS